MNCDLLKFPSKRKVKTLKFDKTNSPFVFYNLISYKSKVDSGRIENKFYVSEITNLPSTEMVTSSYDGECGEKLQVSKKVFKEVPPDKFYIKYGEEK